MRTLREWRVARLMGTKRLADAAGISNKTLIDIELGRRTPHYGTIGKLCAALGVEPGEVEEFAATLEQRGKDAA